MNTGFPPNDHLRFELEQFLASDTHFVAVRAPDGSPLECLENDEEIYPIERALVEAPLPHSAECTCFYAPRWWMEETPWPDTSAAA